MLNLKRHCSVSIILTGVSFEIVAANARALRMSALTHSGLSANVHLSRFRHSTHVIVTFTNCYVRKRLPERNDL